MSLERPSTTAERCAAAYRLACFKARKKGVPAPDRAAYAVKYMAKNSQQPAPLATGATITPPDVSAQPPAAQSPPLSLNSQGETETFRGKQETGEGSRKAGGETPPTPAVESDVPPHAKDTPARLKNGRFPFRRPLCPPASVEQFKHAMAMMSDGATMAAIRRETGADWQALNERGLADYPQDWCAIAQAWKENRALALIDRAQEIALQESPAEISETSGPTGITTTERRKTDPGMLTAALAGLLPEIHGKSAGRHPPVTINANNAAFFGGPAPAGTLDDWTPEGLRE